MHALYPCSDMKDIIPVLQKGVQKQSMSIYVRRGYLLDDALKSAGKISFCASKTLEVCTLYK